MRLVFLPGNLDELWDIWDQMPTAFLYAGGTDLLVRLRVGGLDPPALICIERIEELKGVRDEGVTVFVGAGNTHAGLMDDPLIQAHFPVLTQALGVLAGPPIRHMGTIGGNVVNASPAGETLPPLYVLNAEVEIRSRKGSHWMSISRFISGPGQVRLRSGEIVGGVRIPKPSKGWIHHYEKVGLRMAQACAVASLAALLKTDGNRIIEEVRLAWGSVGPTVRVCLEAEDALRGRPLCIKTLQDVIPAVQAAISPIDDIRASAAYRRIVAVNLLMRLALLGKS